MNEQHEPQFTGVWLPVSTLGLVATSQIPIFAAVVRELLAAWDTGGWAFDTSDAAVARAATILGCTTNKVRIAIRRLQDNGALQ